MAKQKQYLVYIVDRKGSIKCNSESDARKIIDNLIKEGHSKDLIRFKEIEVDY